MVSTGSKGNPIANLSCNWDIVLIFDVLKRFLSLLDCSGLVTDSLKCLLSDS